MTQKEQASSWPIISRGRPDRTADAEGPKALTMRRLGQDLGEFPQLRTSQRSSPTTTAPQNSTNGLDILPPGLHAQLTPSTADTCAGSAAGSSGDHSPAC